MMERAISLLGIFIFLGIAYALSNNRKAIDWKLVGFGVTLQFIFAVLVLKTAAGRWVFDQLNLVIKKLLDFSITGSSFIFGSDLGGPMEKGGKFGFSVLGTIIFFSALMSVLYYAGIMQKVVELISNLMVKFLGTSGAETLSASANIFVGQTEAPLLIKPYVEQMTRSELMVVMTGGFATVAGGVMAAYVAMLSGIFPDIAGHLMAASVMSAPAALVMAKILVPETEEPLTKGSVRVDVPATDSNVIEAAANGASTGLTLALNVGAMLLAFIALVNMMDAILMLVGDLVGYPTLSFSLLFGWLFSPLAYVMGVPWKDAVPMGILLGQKLVINEFVAYSTLSEWMKSGEHQLSGRTLVIASYALCGFANFSSIGIQIGGIGGIAPSRKSDLAKLGVIAVIGGTLARFQTATIAGVLVDESEVKLVQSARVHTIPADEPGCPQVQRKEISGNQFFLPGKFQPGPNLQRPSSVLLGRVENGGLEPFLSRSRPSGRSCILTVKPGI